MVTELTMYEVDFVLLWNCGNFITLNLSVEFLGQSNSDF